MLVKEVPGVFIQENAVEVIVCKPVSNLVQGDMS